LRRAQAVHFLVPRSQGASHSLLANHTIEP
jgi:hypothetical protein